MLRGGKSDKADTLLRPAVVDHLIPHQSDEALLYDMANIWLVCCDCHDQTCQRIENTYEGEAIRKAKLGYRLIGLDGYPKVMPNRPIDRILNDI